MPVEVGTEFRQYRVLEQVGEGGMGVVYRARDTKLGREVALKFLTRLGSGVAGERDRLRHEARSLAALNHPNIVTVHDIDEASGVPYLVLEWIPGRTLADPSRRGPWPPEEFLRVAVPVAEALAAAHDRGIVHRDVKPANVLVTDDGRTKLVDFGLAKFRDQGRDLTETAGALGTVAYMSPEQASGGEVGPDSDVFSFGVLAYELLAGERPFLGEGPGTVLAAIVRDPHVPLAVRCPDLPIGLATVVDTCLQKRPGARFRTGRELADALRRVAHGASPEATPSAAIASSSSGPRSLEQDIRFCTAADGARLAYAVVGRGPVLVRVLGWFTHLELEWQWPELRLLWERLAEHHTVIRYDGRGIGLSAPFTGEFTEETRQLDLDAVVAAAGVERANLLGVSEGGWTAAAYALRHPDRIARLILYGAYSRGVSARPGFDPEEEQAIVTLIRKGWGRGTPMFRQIFTSRFFGADADPRTIAHFNEMQRASADAETAARYVESAHRRGDGGDLFTQIRTPTLVVHCQDDRNISAEEGRRLAALIPDARLVLLPSGAHYFPTDREVANKVVGAVTRFVDDTRGAWSR